MTDATTSPPPHKLRFVNSYRDHRYGGGRMRHQFRRKGYRKVTIKGQPGSPEFMAHYQELLNAEQRLPPASTLRGGIVARRSVDPNTVQPLIGVYLLLLKGKVVYTGSSINMPNRVGDHRKNGRPFDQAYYIATKANEREQLEQTLIKALHPSQNRAHRANGKDDAHADQ